MSVPIQRVRYGVPRPQQQDLGQGEGINVLQEIGIAARRRCELLIVGVGHIGSVWPARGRYAFNKLRP